MTIRWKVALVEDDRRLARAVSAALGDEGYTRRAGDGAGRRLGLPGSEFSILAALMRRRGQLVTDEQLGEGVWAVATGPESNSLEVHVSRIRQKLEGGGESRLIQTVRGIGYRFIAESKEEVST